MSFPNNTDNLNVIAINIETENIYYFNIYDWYEVYKTNKFIFIGFHVLNISTSSNISAPIQITITT